MSEAPETIWATAYYNQNRSEHVQPWSATGFDDRQQVKYRRADLPPTLSAAMELPEVRKLVEAGEVMANALRGGYIVASSAKRWGEALAPFTEPYL